MIWKESMIVTGSEKLKFLNKDEGEYHARDHRISSGEPPLAIR